MEKNKTITIFILLTLSLLLLTFLSLTMGQIKISVSDVLKSLVGVQIDDYSHSVITSIRLPRTLVAVFVGATLSLSGLLTSIALKNPLADSGILGIQSGATIGALVTLLVLPTLSVMLPVFAFVGGIISFMLLILSSSNKNSFSPNKVVLIGVAINAVATSIIGVITIFNANKLKNALTWLNGSMVNVSPNSMAIVVSYSLIMLILTFLMIPVLKILLLDDNAIINIGHNPKFLRIFIAVVAVILASISVAFVGIISFIGIIAPQLAKRLVGFELKKRLIASMLIGGIIVLFADFIQRILFAPMEIPVGILIGIVGAPIFIVLAGRE